MRTSIVNNISFRCPPYLVRAGLGWQVRLPSVSTVYFADGRHGGAGPAYDAAFRALAKANKGLKLRPRFARGESSSKKIRTGIPGVSLRQEARGDRVRQYSLAIAVSSLPVRTLYIGTDNTAPERYPEKLRQAARIREAMIRKVMAARSVAGTLPG